MRGGRASSGPIKERTRSKEKKRGEGGHIKGISMYFCTEKGKRVHRKKKMLISD